MRALDLHLKVWIKDVSLVRHEVGIWRCPKLVRLKRYRFFKIRIWEGFKNKSWNHLTYWALGTINSDGFILISRWGKRHDPNTVRSFSQGIQNKVTTVPFQPFSKLLKTDRAILKGMFIFWLWESQCVCLYRNILENTFSLAIIAFNEIIVTVKLIRRTNTLLYLCFISSHFNINLQFSLLWNCRRIASIFN